MQAAIGTGAPSGVGVSGRGARRWADGHPWIYRSDVKAPDDLASGEIVPVLDPRGRPLGEAFYSQHSQITLRRLTRPGEQAGPALFAERLAAADALRRELYPDQTLYRVVHGEADGLPGLVVDRYDDCLSVQFLVPGTERRKALIVDLLRARFDPRAIVNRSDAAVRRLEGLEQEKGLLYGELPGPVLVREGAMELALDLLGGQKTGAFLDQRENHLLAGDYAHGHALDCFSYAGGFALQMARRAARVTALDVSAEACAAISANAARNGLGNVEVICANAFDFLRGAQEAGTRYDTIVLDPPAFARHKGAVAAGLRGYKEINLRALQLLNPGGVLITASCSYHVDAGMFAALLSAAAADAGREVQVLERRGAARDHPVLLAMPESRYLKCFVLRVRGS